MPRARSDARFSSVPAVAMTVAPSAWATPTAARPRPPAAEWMRTLSPSSRPACSASAYQAVAVTSGRAAASLSDSVAGIGLVWAAGTVRWEATAPKPQATTRSPTATPWTSGPTALTMPAHSAPMRSAPHGVVGVGAHGLHHVDEVERGGGDFDLHLPGGRCGPGPGPELQSLPEPAAVGPQPERLGRSVPRRLRLVAALLAAHEAAGVEAVGPQHALVLAVGAAA